MRYNFELSAIFAFITVCVIAELILLFWAGFKIRMYLQPHLAKLNQSVALVTLRSIARRAINSLLTLLERVVAVIAALFTLPKVLLRHVQPPAFVRAALQSYRARRAQWNDIDYLERAGLVFFGLIFVPGFVLPPFIINWTGVFNLWGLAATGAILGTICAPVAIMRVRRHGWRAMAGAGIGSIAGGAYAAIFLMAGLIVLASG